MRVVALSSATKVRLNNLHVLRGVGDGIPLTDKSASGDLIALDGRFSVGHINGISNVMKCVVTTSNSKGEEK